MADFGQQAWRDCAQSRSFAFPAEGPACACWRCVPIAVPPPLPKPSLVSRLIGCLTCACIFDPVPSPPPGATLACAMDVGCSRPATPHHRSASCGGFLDPRTAKQQYKETVRLAKVNEKVFNARLTAAAAQAKKEAKDAEAKRKADAKAEKQKREAEDKAKREAAKFEAWARRHGCSTVPLHSAPARPPSGQIHVHPPLDYGLRHVHVDAWGNQIPMMSNAMMHAVRGQNREDMLLGMANGTFHMR